MENLKLREELLCQAQGGDQIARDDLIKYHHHFILSVAIGTCKRPITWSDDEASIALISFNEAIDAYSKERGVPFAAFARLVIRSRLVDYFRKEGWRITEGADVDKENTAWEHALAVIAQTCFTEEDVIRERREEIERYEKLLQEFGLSFNDLVATSPKRRRLRVDLLRAARVLAENEVLFNKLAENKRLPLNELSLLTGISPKTLERARGYVIAASIVLHYLDDFTYLYSHCKYY